MSVLKEAMSLLVKNDGPLPRHVALVGILKSADDLVDDYL